MYVELLTRISTQYLQVEHGEEKAALDSIHSLFSLTRDVLKKYNRDCQEFAKIAIPVLNQIIRPFAAKWHRLSMNGVFDNASKCSEFRQELIDLQKELRKYTRMLGAMAGVEDFTILETRNED